VEFKCLEINLLGNIQKIFKGFFTSKEIPIHVFAYTFTCSFLKVIPADVALHTQSFCDSEITTVTQYSHFQAQYTSAVHSKL